MLPTTTANHRTYRCDIWRSPFYGVLEAGWQTFALIVAIRYFDAPESTKSFIAGAGQIGFLLTPLTLFAAARMRARPSVACAFIFSMAALLLVGASLASSLMLFACFVVVSQIVAVQQGPLMLQIYAENYPPSERGSRMTVPLILIASTSIAFAFLGGEWLDRDLERFRWIFLSMAVASGICAIGNFKMPSKALSTVNVGNPLQNIKLIWKDKFFGFLLGTWMILGLGNLVALPIRYEYLVDPEYGIQADNTTIAILMLVIPASAHILTIKIWGLFFDRLHFVTTRNLLNLFFLLSISLFFFSTNLLVLGIAMACQGLAMGGGKIFWGLWVTKIAEQDRASSYMSVHMALTGLRGSIAPFLGYWIFTQSSPQAVAYTGLILIAISIFLFELVRGHHRLKPNRDQN